MTVQGLLLSKPENLSPADFCRHQFEYTPLMGPASSLIMAYSKRWVSEITVLAAGIQELTVS